MKTMLYFSAPWCGPCKTLAPIVNELSSQINVRKINVDNDTELASKFGIRSVPTLVLVENDHEVGRTDFLQYFVNGKLKQHTVDLYMVMVFHLKFILKVN